MGAVNALRRLSRLRQRGGRPDLLVTPIFVGRADDYQPWRSASCDTFISATPFFCPLHLSHGKRGGRRRRAMTSVIRESLRHQGIVSGPSDIHSIREIVFVYEPSPPPSFDIGGATVAAQASLDPLVSGSRQRALAFSRAHLIDPDGVRPAASQSGCSRTRKLASYARSPSVVSAAASRSEGRGACS